MVKRSRPAEIRFYEWYVSRWVTSAAHDELDACGRGIYRELLDACYVQGSVSADHDVICRKCGASAEELEKRWPLIGRHFTESDGRLYHPMADDFRADFFGFVARQKANGTKGGRPPKIPTREQSRNPQVTHQEPTGNPCLSKMESRERDETRRERGKEASDVLVERQLSSASADGEFALTNEQEPQPLQKLQPPKEQYSPKFLEFWAVVWAKTGKDGAWKAWKAAVKREGKDARDQMIDAARSQGPRILADAAKGSRTPIHPATWINQGRWKDEEAAAPKPEEPITRRTVKEIWG